MEKVYTRFPHIDSNMCRNKENYKALDELNIKYEITWNNIKVFKNSTNLTKEQVIDLLRETTNLPLHEIVYGAWTDDWFHVEIWKVYE